MLEEESAIIEFIYELVFEIVLVLVVFIQQKFDV
jgi:hypothetical protein